jgi:hypothetical protein
MIGALGLLALYRGSLGVGYLNDDYLFLEGTRIRSLIESLAGPDALGGFFRPLSRSIYFAALSPIAGDRPLIFHLVNAALFLGGVALVIDLLLALVPASAALAGALYFAVLPLQRVNLTWISCAQDLLALTASLGALALYRRGRTRGAALLCLAAVASKEAALPLPLALLAWDRLIERRRWRQTIARGWPAALVALAWACVLLAIRAGHAGAAEVLRFGPGQFLAGYAHLLQSLLGLEQPAGMPRSLAANGPDPLALLALGALALWVVPSGRAPARAASGTPPPAPRAGAADAVHAARPRPAIAFALVWLAAFGFVTGPVAHLWSAYYYTLAAVGGAVLVALAARRITAWGWLALCAGLLWWHAGASTTRAFGVAARAWIWSSHVTSASLERAGALTDTLSAQLRRLEPSPPRGTRLFFATLPPAAGFQSGTGALVRRIYRDPTLGSHFYSEFSEATAADHPLRFLFWDGERLEPLYRGTRDPLFQVGSDLLLLGSPAGAGHAFRRGLAEGGDPLDLLYWLGWAEIMRGNRREAEAAWRAWGARDDSLSWFRSLRMAQTALADRGDTLGSRRLLMDAIRCGIGRPEAHAVLGQLLARERPKYGALESMVATWLKPDDWVARRDLVLILVAARLDERAREELRVLERIDPDAAVDPAIAGARRVLERRAGSGVLEF